MIPSPRTKIISNSSSVMRYIERSKKGRNRRSLGKLPGERMEAERGLRTGTGERVAAAILTGSVPCSMGTVREGASSKAGKRR